MIGSAFLMAPTTSADNNPPSNVVRIEVSVPGVPGTSIGSGVILADGHIVTANHVIEDSRSAEASEATPQVIKVAVEGGVTVKARVVWADKDNDIALLSSSYSGTAQLSCSPLQIGQPIEAVGNPLDLGFTHTWGRVSSKPRSFKGQWKSVVLAQIAIAPGNSGGPAFDPQGHVVGIVVGMITAPMSMIDSIATGLATIVPSRTVCDLIAAHRRVAAPGV